MKPAYREKFERAVFDESQDEARWILQRLRADEPERCPTEGDIGVSRDRMPVSHGTGHWRPAGHWYPIAAQSLGDHALGDWIDRYLPVERWCAYCHKRLHGVFIDPLAEEDAEFDPELNQAVPSRWNS